MAIHPANASTELLAWLRTPQAYPHRPQAVEHVETHISHVFLAGDLVYKLKKGVRFPFLDFSTLERREHACREELRLNRRLAEHVYLDVIPVRRGPAGQFTLGEDPDDRGEVVEWLVQMRRLPAERMLDSLYHHGELRPYHIDQLAALLARFYASAPRAPFTEEAYRQRCLAHVGENRESLRNSLPAGQAALVERVHAFQLQLLRLRPELFDARVQAGRIVEGHGDLRAEHICLTEPIAIFDCIEFREEFRQLDLADEIAFLVADCDFLGAEWIGPRLVHRFGQLSGDRPPAVLLDFYKAYRACVRGKVAALRALQLEGSEKEKATHEALAHLEFADRYAAPHQHPLVLVVGGLSGTGKTTLARRLAEELSARPISSDVVRQELFGRSGAADEVGAGKYSPEQRLRVYEEMLRRASDLQRDGLSVVLDATFQNTEPLHAAHDLARDQQAVFLAVECECPPDVALERISRRQVEGRDASEAHAEVYDQQARARAPWPETIPHVRVDSTTPLNVQAERVLERVRDIIRGDASR